MTTNELLMKLPEIIDNHKCLEFEYVINDINYLMMIRISYLHMDIKIK